MTLSPGNVFLCLVGLAVALLILRYFQHVATLTAQRLREHDARTTPSPRLADSVTREVNTVVSELRVHLAEVAQLHHEAVAAAQIEARRAEARTATAATSLRPIVQQLADVATTLSVQVRALQRERAAARVEAITGKPLGDSDGTSTTAPTVSGRYTSTLAARDPLATLASETDDDRKTAEHGAALPTPADDWDDLTRVAEDSGRRTIRPGKPDARRVAS